MRGIVRKTVYIQSEDSMKQTIYFKAVLCAVFTILLLAMNYVLFTVYASYRIGLTTVYVAVRDLPPRTRIRESDLAEVQIPKGYVLPSTVTKKEEILDQITPLQGMIPAGSPFYRSMLEDPEKIWDYGVSLLKEGQTAYRLILDPSQLRTLSDGMRCDVHITVSRKDSAPLSGVILVHARILTMRDRQGLFLSDPDSSGVPYLAEIAIQREDIELLTAAESIGTLRLFASEAPYAGMEAARAENSEALRWLLEQIQKAVPEGTAQSS